MTNRQAKIVARRTPWGQLIPAEALPALQRVCAAQVRRSDMTLAEKREKRAVLREMTGV